jgi:hypothetical protein
VIRTVAVLLVAASVVGGCARKGDGTVLVVSVLSDLAVPNELDAVEIVVADGELHYPVALGEGAGRHALPVQVALVPGGENNQSFDVEARGSKDGKLVVAQAARVSFTPAHRQELVLYLARGCVSVPPCPSGTSCQNGMCLDNAMVGDRRPFDPRQMIDSDAGPDSGATMDGGAAEIPPSAADGAADISIAGDGAEADRGQPDEAADINWAAPDAPKADSTPACVPQGPEVCNGRDDDCDGVIDNGAGCTFTAYQFAGLGKSYAWTDGAGATLTWADADARCKLFGYHLAIIDSAAQMDIIRSHAASAVALYWIGLSKAQGEWTWIDGARPVYAAWAPGADTSPTKTCALLRFDVSNAGVWTPEDCSSHRGMLCQAP